MRFQRALALLSLLLASPLAADTATLVLTGGRVWTADPARPWEEAVALRGDLLLAVGSAAEVARLRGAGTRWIELNGRFVAPGFIDNHTPR